MATSRLIVDPAMIKRAESDDFALAFARIECHYFVNGGFFKCTFPRIFFNCKDDGQLIEEATKLKNIPGTIVQVFRLENSLKNSREDMIWCAQRSHLGICIRNGLLLNTK